MKTAMPYVLSRFYSMWKLYKYPAPFSSISTIYFFHKEIFLLPVDISGKVE